MREILFRGKATDGSDWVYGSLHIEYGEMANGDTERSLDYRILGMCGDCCYVDPETVGQYTGLTDKNGKRIFEGDIIKDDWGKVYKVFFTDKSCSFMVRIDDTPNEYEKGDYRIGKAWTNTIRVIGNIHDNPELLKGGK